MFFVFCFQTKCLGMHVNNVLTLRNACGHVLNKQRVHIGCLLGCTILMGFLRQWLVNRQLVHILCNY